ncbi:fructose-bisphosphate aldolase C-like isoform X4 [Linepithema humile]|uniref:fructose-bisphosphate aldolase C-like isoform X4 n=1 Tax=Linepithema humile TaxID=83485 RepID=UPI00351F5B91
MHILTTLHNKNFVVLIYRYINKLLSNTTNKLNKVKSTLHVISENDAIRNKMLLQRQELHKIIETIAAPGKGLLACDESPLSLNERFHMLGIENTESTRRDYREMLLSADKTQLSRYISGVIMHCETIYQRTSEDVEFIEFLRQRNIVAGVKIDQGLVPLFGTEDEKTTQGLDDLQENCIRYKKEGCHFAKWRCVFSMSERCPSQLAMTTNANVLARYASICQRARMVPIVEPEILSKGEHDINRTLQVHEEMLSILFRVLNKHHVYLEGMVLKPAMVLPGIKNEIKCTPQDTAMKVWTNNPKNIEKAQAVLLERAKLCSEASLGKLQLGENNICT